MTLAVEVRRARSEEAPLVVSILREAAVWLEQRGVPLWSDGELAPETIRHDVDEGHYLLAFSGELAVGTARLALEDALFWPEAAADEAAYLHRLAVRRSSAGGVVSAAILDWALAHAAGLGRRFLRLDCDAERPELRALYERCGFAFHSELTVGPYFVARYQKATSGNAFKGRAEHSAEYFGSTRDHWWNREFLELIAKRWRFEAVREVLDVGCGVGHWGMLLATVMPVGTRVTGVDREPQWVEQATARARAGGRGGLFSFRPGEAERLPFADDSFDLTTCQTVLIHLPDPARAISEMLRVTRPGGLVVVAEPNNLAESLLLDSVTHRASIDELVELVRFQLTCERGKLALGEGDNSLGNRVAGLFVSQGLERVEVYVNDKATAIFPPYETEEQRQFSEEARDRVARRFWNWSEADTRRFFLAGGGAEHAFDAHFARGLAARERIVGGLDDRSYHGIHGGGFYLVAGRKGPT